MDTTGPRGFGMGLEGSGARAVLAIVLLAILSPSGCATPSETLDPIDWQAADEHWSVHVVTLDPDGDERVTRIWLALLDDEAVIRTNGSRWWENIQREAKCHIRLDDVDYEVAAVAVDGAEERVRIDDAFLEKYGWLERLLFPQERGRTHDNYARLRASKKP